MTAETDATATATGLVPGTAGMDREARDEGTEGTDGLRDRGLDRLDAPRTDARRAPSETNASASASVEERSARLRVSEKSSRR